MGTGAALGTMSGGGTPAAASWAAVSLPCLNFARICSASGRSTASAPARAVAFSKMAAAPFISAVALSNGAVAFSKAATPPRPARRGSWILRLASSEFMFRGR